MFGDNLTQEVENELNKRIYEAKKNDLSWKGVQTLRKSFEKHKSVFKMGLGTGGPAKVRPMKICLDKNREPVKSKIRRYPAEQRKFLIEYLTKLSL